MAYITSDDVKKEFKAIEWSAQGIPDTSVDEFIIQEEAYLNGRIANYYLTPVDVLKSPESFKIMRKISTYLVVWRVKKILRVKTPSNKTDQDSLGDEYKMAMEMIDQICLNSLLLEDAEIPPMSTGVSEVYYNTEPPVFVKFKPQW